jgi:hypothetical protein
VIVVVPLQAGLLGEPGRAAGLRRAGQPRGAWAAERNQGCEVSSLSVTGEEPGRTAEVLRNGAVCFRLRRSGDDGGVRGGPGGAFLNPLPHPRGRSDPTTGQASWLMPCRQARRLAEMRPAPMTIPGPAPSARPAGGGHPRRPHRIGLQLDAGVGGPLGRSQRLGAGTAVGSGTSQARRAPAGGTGTPVTGLGAHARIRS